MDDRTRVNLNSGDVCCGSAALKFPKMIDPISLSVSAL